MALCMITFLGRPRFDRTQESGAQPRYETVAYDFGNGAVSREMPLFGLALFEELLRQGRRPDRVIFLGTKGSQWDCLHELSGSDADEDILSELELGEAVTKKEVQQEQLDRVEEILSGELGGIAVRCALITEAHDRESQLEILQTIAKSVDDQDEVLLDITHGFRHWGVLGLESLLFLRQVGQVAVGGIYYANYAAKNADGAAQAVRLDAVDTLADWSEALASFRQTGRLSRLPELFDEDHREIAVPLARLRYALMSNRFGIAANAAQQARGGLLRLIEEEGGTLAGFFAESLVEEFKLFIKPYVADWQMDLAWRAFYSGDYLRAAICAFEAIISASIRDPGKRQHGKARWDAYELLKDETAQEAPIRDMESFWELIKLRNALAHGGTAYPGSTVDRALRDEKSLTAFLERTLGFAAKTVEELKESPLY